MRGAISISYTTNWKEIAEIVIPNVIEYATRHGYSIFITVEEPYEKYTGLQKLENLRKLILDFDFILSLDCDCLITNHAIPIESFLNTKDDLYLCSGLNCGVFILAVGAYSVELLDWAIDKIKGQRFHCEQDAFEAYIKENQKGVSVLNHPAFNSFIPELYGHIEHSEEITEQQGRWIEGKSFILHLPALSLPKRLEIMRSIKTTR